MSPCLARDGDGMKTCFYSGKKKKSDLFRTRVTVLNSKGSHKTTLTIMMKTDVISFFVL